MTSFNQSTSSYVLQTCTECGADLRSEDRNTFLANLHEHLITVHGYVREGAQVFKPLKCAAPDCTGHGLYRASSNKKNPPVFCRAHKHLAVKLTQQDMRVRDLANSEQEYEFRHRKAEEEKRRRSR